MGSMAPGALLFTAYEAYRNGGAEADDYLRAVGAEDFGVAVEQCLKVR